MPLIAVTGGVGSGKSACTRMLVGETGAQSIDTDQIARDLVERDPMVAAEIREAFGDGVVAPDGTVQRTALREAVFADPAARRALEAILHPRIRETWTRWAGAAGEGNGGSAILLVEIPLLYETGAAGLFDFVIVTGCSPETQVRRLVETRRLSHELAGRILASQIPIADKLRQADAVIWNDGSRAACETQVALCARHLSLLF